MRRITFLFFFIVSFYHGLSQQPGKVKHTISNGLHIEGVDETNPVIYDNDMVLDTPEDEFLWLKAHNGKVKLVGNIMTRDFIGCVFPAGQTCNVSLQETIDGWSSTWQVAQAAGLKNVPRPVVGASQILNRPSSGKIEDTRFNSSAGADLIINEAHKASAQRPLVIFVGANVSTIANAYLKDPSIAPKIVVLQIHGYHNSPTKTVSYNTTDPWATYVVMKKFRYINWAGDSRSWYWTPVKNVNLTQSMINQLPSNPLANALKTWYQRFFSRESLADAPMVLYFFNHSLWRSVEKRLENGQITTSDTYDYLMVSGNNWTSYGPDLVNYMKDPNNYLAGAQAPAPNTSPSVSLSSPINNAQFTTGATISITASATDSDGTISKVEFYNGSTKLGEDIAAPYSFDWKNVVAGSFTITAKATDNRGATATSSPRSLIIQQANIAPEIRITSPANNASISHGTSIIVNASASDANGQIAKVEFYHGTTKLGEDSSGPFSFTWTNVASGKYSLTAKAFDDRGLATTSSAVNITVQDANTAPAVTITSPSPNTSVEYGAQISIAANATDATGNITKVEFYNKGNKLGEDVTSPFSFQWNNASAGTHSLTAKAFDNEGLSTVSSPVNITVKAANTAPTVTITSPSPNASVEYGTQISITANAQDASGSVTRVEFYNKGNKLGEDVTSPFSFQWNNAAAGTHSLTAKAFDNEGLSTVSSPVNITVKAANTAPTVTITSPSPNASVEYGTQISITANAQDASGSVTRVEFYNKGNKLGEDVTSPFSFQWNNAAAGTHSLTAKAFDNEGLSTVSSPVNITVKAANTAPTVTITSPSPNASVEYGTQISITANAQDASGSVTRVEFYNKGNKLGEDVTSPFSFQWNNAAAGTHSLTAKAFDNEGLSTVSSPVNITVKAANTAPTVTITSPSPNASVEYGTQISITANAQDASGSVTRVEFYNKGNKLGEDVTSPFSFQWNNAAAGTHSLTAKAFDNKGLSTTSSPVSVVVLTPNTAPNVAITSPKTNSTISFGSSISIAATATDQTGYVRIVEFYNGSTKLGEDSSSPYTFVWTDVPSGKYSITAKAVDDKELSAMSTPVSITVQPANVAPLVAITSPVHNTSFTHGAPLTITAHASDANGTITRVEFYNGNTKLGEDTSSPFTFVWTNPAIGTHTLVAKAIDNHGTAKISDITQITVAAPVALTTVKITSPATNSSFIHNAPVTIAAQAAVTHGKITKVEFYNNGNKLGEDATSPYAYTWNGAPIGKQTLTVKATTDKNISEVSNAIVIEIKSPQSAQQSPTPAIPSLISIVQPQANSSFVVGSTVQIDAEASHAAPISKVEFYDTDLKLGEATTRPYTFKTQLLSPGSHVITVKGISNGNVFATDEVTIHIIGPPTANAGEDITVSLPENSTILKGEGKSVDGSVLEHSWTLLKGPDEFAFNNSITPETTLHDLVEGAYTFEYMVTDIRGLIAKDQVTVIVVGEKIVSPEVSLPIIPRFFTPNDDGINDMWELPEHDLLENAVVTIFNSVGQKVYESPSTQNGWDGKLEGKPLQEDAYYYIIRLKDSNDIKGAVRIIR